MIQVELSDDTRRLLDAFRITKEQIEGVVNNYDRGVVDRGLNRLIALRWLSDREAILVDSIVTRRRVEDDGVTIESVRAVVALKLDSDLPAGRIERGSELEPLMITVAESFGQPVSFHRSAHPVALYGGPWEANVLNFGPSEGDDEVLVLATVDAAAQSVFAGWALNPRKYLDWLRPRSPQPQQHEADYSSERISHHDDWRPSADARDIEFSGDFTNQSLREFGIKSDQALACVNTPDRTDEIEFHGSIIRLHFKALPTQPPSGLLVVESVKDSKRSIDFAFRTYPQLAPGVHALRPLEILRRITDNFGFLIRVGRQVGKLIHSESFVFNGTLLEGSETPRGSFVQQCYFKIGDGPTQIAYCALAYCIDTDLYSSWLRNMARRVN